MPGDSIIDHYIEAGGGVLFEWEPREASSGSLAITVAGVGDSNGDGIDDFVVGDQQGTVGAVFQGVSYLIHGRQDFPWRVTLPYAMGSPITTEEIVRLGAQDIDQSGRCVGSAGDYNGDGHPDFLIGSQGNASIDFEMPGRMHVVFGGSDLPPTLDLASLGRHGFRLEGIRPVTWMTVASLNSGDLNDDGAADFAFTEVSSPYWQLEDGSMPPGSVHVVYGIPPSVPFIRGDADGDGRLNITDGVFTLSHLFLGGVNPLCEDATDTDDRGTVELTDAVYFLNHLFLGGPEPPAPYPTPGDDPTEDGLGCRGF
jgi:hypothetical protein